MLLLEMPTTVGKIGLLARKKGKYIRPIVGIAVDFRLEDYVGAVRPFVGLLPDISEIGQIHKYVIYDGRSVFVVTGDHTPTLAADWWTWAMLLDDNYAYIKAPRRPRPGTEPTPEQIDERLDDFVENRGTVFVRSPVELSKRTRRVDYRRRLHWLG